MQRFCILRNIEKDPDGAAMNRIRDLLLANGASVECVLDASDTPKDAECLIILGGDGTVLRAARKVAEQKTPLIGFNMGTLGYLTETGRDNMEESVGKLLSGNFGIEERMMVTGRILRDGELLTEKIALNDIVVSRKGPLRVMRFEVSVNEEPLSSFRADGMVIATPTGSTGYSLSGGGPVVSPPASLLVLTPIASHTINMRSIILPDSDVVRVAIRTDRDPGTEPAAVYYDGEEETPLRTGDYVEITKASVRTRLIRITGQSFLEILKQKLQM